MELRQSRAPLCFVAAACVALYLGAQIVQQILVRAVLPAPGGPEEAMLGRLLPAEGLRAILLLASHFALVPVYVAVALRRRDQAPGAAACGLLFGMAFVLFEIAYRTLDLFLVSRGWAVDYAAATDADLRAALLDRTGMWERAVGAWYFALLAAHLAASLCFLAACARRRPGAWDVLAQIAFGLNALRIAGRMLGTWGGMDWLAPLSARFYFPPVALYLVLLLVWLARQGLVERLADRQARAAGA